jgi:putative serine protease PepD
MPRRPRTPLLASLLAAACIGAGGGAVAYSTLSDRGTVVRQVTVQNAEPAAISSLSVNSIYRRAYRGVVEITVASGGGLGGSSQAEGSGFVYDSSGHIVTNQHVVGTVSKSISVKFWNGKTYPAQLVGSDSSTDLAVIKVDAPASQLHPLTLGASGKLVVGDPVVAIGSPFGLEETVTTGIVSALHRSIDSLSAGFRIADSIQTDAAINHGNSGGPLLNSQGQVIGVNAQIRSDSGDNAGIGFAIPSDTIRSIAGQLISNGKAVHAYLGVSLDGTATSARVAGIRPGTPAAKSHLRAGDVITAVGGTTVHSAEALTQAIDAHQPGDTVTIKIRRAGKDITAQVKLANRPS